jgi:hypothetical protein
VRRLPRPASDRQCTSTRSRTRPSTRWRGSRSFVYIPRGTPHTWLNAGESFARFVFTLTPAAPAFERFFVRYAELPPEERGVEAFTRLAHEMQAMEVVGPPLGTNLQ